MTLRNATETRREQMLLGDGADYLLMQSCHQPSICVKKKKKAISAKYSQRNTACVYLYAENAWILFLNIIDAELIYNVVLFPLYSKVIQL